MCDYVALDRGLQSARASELSLRDEALPQDNQACALQMATLVVAEHSQGLVAKSTMSAITAAAQLGSEPVHVLIAGEGVQQAAEEARKIAGVGKVIVADSPALQGWLAEPVSALLQSLIRRCVTCTDPCARHFLRVREPLGQHVAAMLVPLTFFKISYCSIGNCRQ